jgi:hypothetical protein
MNPNLIPYTELSDTDTANLPVSGVFRADEFSDYKIPDTVLRENGTIPYPDGMYRKFVPCKVLKAWEQSGLFGKKYYFTIRIFDQIKDIRVGVQNYYDDQNMTSIHMESKDGIYWEIVRS